MGFFRTSFWNKTQEVFLWSNVLSIGALRRNSPRSSPLWKRTGITTWASSIKNTTFLSLLQTMKNAYSSEQTRLVWQHWYLRAWKGNALLRERTLGKCWEVLQKWVTENEKQKSGILKVFFIEFAVKPSEFDRGFLGRSELILPSKSPLTPSFVGSNPATAAKCNLSWTKSA